MISQGYGSSVSIRSILLNVDVIVMAIQSLNLYLFSDGEINMVMEYMEGGSLDLVMKKIGKIEEQYSRKITHAVRILF